MMKTVSRMERIARQHNPIRNDPLTSPTVALYSHDPVSHLKKATHITPLRSTLKISFITIFKKLFQEDFR
jgi:hypothetical protein